jgi:nucleoside 2-deoxyribosyltransferase
MKKVYISGKITGIETEAIELFSNAEKILENAGFDSVNPMKLEHNHDKKWESYMKEDIKALLDCDYIFMLTNWMESPGALIEHKIANYLGIEVFYEKSFSQYFKP